MLWTISEFIWTPDLSWIVRWTNCPVCYFHLCRLQTVLRSLTKKSLLLLVHAFVASWVDHCNDLLFGSYSYLPNQLRSVLNSVPSSSATYHLPFVTSFTGFQTRKRINFKIALMVQWFNTACFGAALEYPLSNQLSHCWQGLWSATCGDLNVLRFRLQTFSHRAVAVVSMPFKNLIWRASMEDATTCLGSM